MSAALAQEHLPAVASMSGQREQSVEHDGVMPRGPVVPGDGHYKGHRQTKSQQGQTGPSQHQHQNQQQQGQRCHRQRPSQHQHLSTPLPSLTIFHPRPYEEIYAEQTYLNLTLQSHTSRLCDLISKFHMSEEDSIYGESRKVKRRARRQIGILRSQIKFAAEQEKTIFARLGELLVEAKSREALDAARQHSLRQWTSHPQEHIPAPSVPESHLNGATAEFIPGKPVRDERADSAVAISTDSDDGKDDFVGDEMHMGQYDSAMSLGSIPEMEPMLVRPRRLSGSGMEGIKMRRRSSLPNIGSIWFS